MKVTKELKDKTKRLLSEKINSEIANIREKEGLLEQKAQDELFVCLTNIVEQNDDYKNAILTLLRTDRLSKEHIARYIGSYYLMQHSSYKAEYNKLQQERADLKESVTRQLEDLMIELSYGKTIEDIETAFLKFGLKF